MDTVINETMGGKYHSVNRSEREDAVPYREFRVRVR